MIWLFPDFLPASRCDELIGLAQEAGRRQSRMRRNTSLNTTQKKVLDVVPEKGSVLESAIREIDHAITYRICELADFAFDEVGNQLDGNFYEYSEGDFYVTHTDAQFTRVEDDRVVAKRYINRDFSSVLFLNDDFEGGLLQFMHDKRVIEPQKGLLVIFQSGWYNDHCVTMVTQGKRYTIANWFYTYPQVVPDFEVVPEPYASDYRKEANER